MQIDGRKEVIDYYLTILEEELYVHIKAFKTNLKRLKVYKDNLTMNNNFKSELKKYFEACKLEKKICMFMILNDRKLHYNDIIRTLNLLDDNGEYKLRYIDDFIDMLDTACDLNLDYKFYIPRNKIEFEMDENNYLKIAKGFDIESVKDFLLEEEVYDEISLKKAMDRVKYLSVVSSDSKIFSGVFNKGIVIPNVCDGQTALIAIRELVHYALSSKKDSIKDIRISDGEILPIFYELLYRHNNTFINDNIHSNIYSVALLDDYMDEPLDKQIKKLKRII